jgi:ABC-type phosphate/phosphonate transport system permease subunit
MLEIKSAARSTNFPCERRYVVQPPARIQRYQVILGYVGAGGLGQQIQIAISLFLEHRLLTLLLALYLIVTVVDYLSAYLRGRLI